VSAPSTLTLSATLAARAWSERQAARRGAPVSDDEVRAHVERHWRMLRDKERDYVLANYKREKTANSYLAYW